MKEYLERTRKEMFKKKEGVWGLGLSRFGTEWRTVSKPKGLSPPK